MRAALVAVAALAACKSNGGKPKDGGPVIDAKLDGGGGGSDAPGPDAPPPHAACTPGTAGSSVVVRKIGKANGAAMLATSPPGDARLFVVEQDGAIRIFKSEVKQPIAFLDISGSIVAGGEQGLLGLAFHPSYATNGYFYVFYTANNPNHASDPHNPYVDVLARFTVSAGNPDVADPASKQILLSIPDFASNHNGGMIEFGSDGFLYIGTGDGGSAGDPDRNGQNTNALLAKILRIDVDHPAGGKNYGIPAGNPFAAGGGAPEVWIYGLRNPWRWSFDRGTGDLWIGDVGQDLIEELDVLKAGEQAGKNLGWSVYEAISCCATETSRHCDQDPPYQACDSAPNRTDPLLTHTHSPDGWNAIIGGQVYRGACFPDLVGWEFFTDNGHHGLSKARLKGDGTLEVVDLAPVAPATSWPASPASIHADSRGELYLTTTSGDIYAIEAQP